VFWPQGETQLACKTCGSGKQLTFNAEIAIHLREPDGRGKPLVWIFPELFVCLNCGNNEFVVPESQQRTLAEKRCTCGAMNHRQVQIAGNLPKFGYSWKL